MPKLRRLSGEEIVRIFEKFGFAIVAIKGSHYKLRRIVDNQKQTLHVPVHGKQPLASGTISAIYKQACAYIPESELKPHFFAE